jgi:hypothetical protein
VSLALAALLLGLRFASRANRAFALYLGSAAGVFITLSLSAAGDTPAEAAFWLRMLPYFLLTYPFTAVYFASVYPRPRPMARFGAAPFLAAPAVLMLLYAADHTRFQYLSTIVALPGQPLLIQGALTFLYILVLRPAGFGVPVLIAHWASREPPGRRRSSMLLVTLGFATTFVYFVLIDALRTLSLGAGPAVLLAVGLELGVIAVLAAVVAWNAVRGPDAWARRAFARYGVVLALILASAVAGHLLAAGGNSNPRFFFNGVWYLGLPVLTTYALLRAQLFDIDLKVKWTIKQSTVAAAFIGVFFVVSESASNFFASSGLGPYLGIAAAGLLVFAMAPLQRAAERVASAAMPGVKAGSELSRHERLGLYREQLRVAYADSVVDRNERALLLSTRRYLGISTEEAERLEHEVVQGGGT